MRSRGGVPSRNGRNRRRIARTELPGTEWLGTPLAADVALDQVPMPAKWPRIGEVRHVFTHFELRLTVFAASVSEIQANGFLHQITELQETALPSVMRKCVRLAISAAI